MPVEEIPINSRPTRLKISGIYLRNTADKVTLLTVRNKRFDPAILCHDRRPKAKDRAQFHGRVENSGFDRIPTKAAREPLRIGGVPQRHEENLGCVWEVEVQHGVFQGLPLLSRTPA